MINKFVCKLINKVEDPDPKVKITYLEASSKSPEKWEEAYERAKAQVLRRAVENHLVDCIYGEGVREQTLKFIDDFQENTRRIPEVNETEEMRNLCKHLRKKYPLAKIYWTHNQPFSDVDLSARQIVSYFVSQIQKEGE